MNERVSTGEAGAVEEKRSKVFRDPIHDLIYFGPEDTWALKLIETKEFQRLRRIRQLGLTHLVYPGAEHSRFTHSLGVFNFARRMIRHLLDRHRGDDEIKKELVAHEKTIKAAALLHDIGHGPFSHVFERAFEGEGLDLKKHDEWSCKILRDEGTEVHKALLAVGIEIDGVCQLIVDEHPTDPVAMLSSPYLKDIVSSQLDADRMDYLLRDSLMTGSRYGQYDSEWIMNALVISKVGEHEGRPIRKLCLDASKGTGAIEGLLFARRLMHRYVYGHKTTRAYEAQLIQALRIAVVIQDVLPDETPGPLKKLLRSKGDLETDDYLMLDDEVMWWALRCWARWDGVGAGDEGLSHALAGHALGLVRRQEPWKSIDITKDQVVARDGVVAVSELKTNGDPLRFHCHIDTLSDLPYKDYHYFETKQDEGEPGFLREIFLLTREGKPVILSQWPEANMIRALTEPSRLSRFCYNRKYSQEFAGLRKKFGVC